jgi:putative tryptophan/tyrosine transport system substrate-binding protein
MEDSRTFQFGAIQSAAQSLHVEATPVEVREQGEIESAVDVFARSPNGGLLVTASAGAAVHRKLIVSLAARHRRDPLRAPEQQCIEN